MTVIEQDGSARRERRRQTLLRAFRTVGLLDLPNFANFLLHRLAALPDVVADLTGLLTLG